VLEVRSSVEGRALITIAKPIRLVFCHGLPERCLKVRGKPMRICARCFGVLIGQTAAVLTVFCLGCPSYWTAAVLLLPIGIDWSVQRFVGIDSTNLRRFTTGVVGGVGFGLVQIKLFLLVLNYAWTSVAALAS
jgi:uncharacterized membrane protein